MRPPDLALNRVDTRLIKFATSNRYAIAHRRSENLSSVLARPVQRQLFCFSTRVKPSNCKHYLQLSPLILLIPFLGSRPKNGPDHFKVQDEGQDEGQDAELRRRQQQANQQTDSVVSVYIYIWVFAGHVLL